MRIRRTLIALVTVAGVGLGLATAVTPAQAAENVTTLELDASRVQTVGDVLAAVEASSRVRLGAPERAVVVTDNGRAELTASEIDALLNGRDAGDTRLLATYDSVTRATGLGDLRDPGGSEQAL